tara:strand:+ start:3572 stop:5764 length:2193 start_codon:yes stop_codon:yes gene_type:complete
MTKIILKTLSIIIFLIVFLIVYFSLVGFETERFNNQIKENLKKIDTRLDVKLNNVKIILDLFNLKISTKTLGPIISHNNKSIDLELIKSDVSLLNLFNDQFTLSNLYISTKSVKIREVIAFYRSVNKNNKTQLFILENLINKGFLIADIKLNFDDKGNVKEDFKINGLIRDSSLNFLNKQKIDNINFIFEAANKKLGLNDLKFSYSNINFTSEKVEVENKDNFFNIKGEINNDETSLSENALKKLFNPFLKLDYKNLKFSSQNKFLFKINKKFKVSDYEIKTLLNIDELLINYDLNLKDIFPDLQSEVSFKNHQTEITFKKNNFLVNGNGEFLIQKNHDKAYYKIEKNGSEYLFDTKINFIKNPINFSFLNYRLNENTLANLELNGRFLKDKTLSLENIKFEKDSDLIRFKNLELTDNLKVSELNSAIFDYVDIQNKKNNFQAKQDGKNFIISGKVFNASKLIEDLIFGDNQNRDIFEKNYSIVLDLDEVYLHDNDVVYDLDGNLNFVNNEITYANINSKFNDNEKISFTLTSKDNQKVTTFYSDQAKPFVKKFNFIKGFEKGSLDFYSVKSKDMTNSKLKIFDFNLKELPALTKILTLASLQGIADLLSGEGIGFSEFEMNFQNKNKLMTIDEIYAIGPAISILMEGYIEESKLVSLRGTLVPATTINKAIGSIPILGDILVGKKTGEGVFGVSFKIKGPPKKIETTVNPIKTLTPRFITRTLEKIKKN